MQTVSDMDLLQIVLLAVVQGLTEFLPISSSAHLILAPRLFDFVDQGLAFDVAVHIGSLLAVTLYFRDEIILMTRDFFASVTGGKRTEHSQLAWMIIISTIPIVIIGKLFVDLVSTDLRSTLVIAITTILFGLLLYWFDKKGKQVRSEFTLNWRGALIIGLFQTLAIIPGTSRSGITMTAGMMLGLTREAASRYSFLLSIPTIAMSGILVTYELSQQTTPVDWQSLLLGAALSFVAAYLCIKLFLQFIQRIGMTPFVIYRLLLGALLLYIAV